MYNMVRIFGALFLSIRSYHVVAKSKKVSSIKTHSSILLPKSLSQQKYFDYLEQRVF